MYTGGKDRAFGSELLFKKFAAEVARNAKITKAKFSAATGIRFGIKLWKGGARVIKKVIKPKTSGNKLIIGDDELERELLTQCAPAARWHHGRGKATSTLQGSLFACGKKAGILKKISYRTLCRRTRIRTRPRLAVSIGKTKADKCGICITWDTRSKLQLSNKLAELKLVLEGLCARYWDTLDDWLKDSQVFEHKDDVASLPFLDAMLAFTTLRGDYCVADMEKEAREKLLVAESEVNIQLQSMRETSELFNWHFQLRDLLQSELVKDQTDPPPLTIVILADYKDYIYNII